MSFTTNQLDLGLKGSTGTGQFVGDNDPVLVNPNIGTPSAGTLTNCTGLPLGSITGLGTNVDTWLATPSSANLLAAMTDETGTGALVFANTPTLISPVLGTPTSGTLTNCTGLPVAGGGTGVASLTAYSVICGGTTGTGAVQSVSGLGTSGQVLTSNGAAALPTWQNAPSGGSGAWTLISTATASNSASLEFTSLSSTYQIYKFFITDLQPITDNTFLYLRTSTDNGSTWDSTSGDYAWALNRSTTSASPQQSLTATAITLISNNNGYGVGTGANEFVNAEITLYNPAGTNYTFVSFVTSYVNASGTIGTNMGVGVRKSAADVDGIQFLMSSGNISTGIIKMYGITAS